MGRRMEHFFSFFNSIDVPWILTLGLQVQFTAMTSEMLSYFLQQSVHSEDWKLFVSCKMAAFSLGNTLRLSIDNQDSSVA